MGKVAKKTRKFNAKHLKSAIRQRKTLQKIKRARQQKEAERAHKTEHNAQDSIDKGQQAAISAKALENMSIDEFLDGGFLDAQPAAGSGAIGVSENINDQLSDSDVELDSQSNSEEDIGVILQSAAIKTRDDQRQTGRAGATLETNKQAGNEQQSAAGDYDNGSACLNDSAGSTEDEDEQGAVGQARRSHSVQEALDAEIKSHKTQLEALKEQDPEFYAYLQSTDKELLSFGKDPEDELDIEEEEEEEDEALGDVEREQTGGGGAGAGDQQHQPGGVTMVMVEGWCDAARDKASMGALRNILKAYRVACRYGDSEEQVEESMRIASSAVYNKLMLFVLREIDGIFRRILVESGSAKQQQQPLAAAVLVNIPRWKKVEPLVKSYLGNSLHLLGALTDSTMLTFILRRLRASTVLMAPFEKLQRRLLKVALGLFGAADNAPRVQAVLMVRQMALELPQPALDNCLKGVYRAFSTNAKFVNSATMPQINFMAAAVVEMYGINPAVSYQHAFNFIRQLAMLMRSAMTRKSKEAYREVYCWQTINCLELWAKLLAAKANEGQLRPLIYPVTQLLLGVARLVPAPAYFPLRLRCARALNRLGEATNTFIPVAPILLEVLQWSALRKAPKQGGGQQPDVLLQLHVSEANMRTPQFQTEIMNQVAELLAEHLACWGCHIAFPELAYLTLSQLRKFMKNTMVERFKKTTKQLIEAIEKTVVFVGRARDQVDFSPKDLDKVGTFLAKEKAAKQAPIQQYARALLDRARERLQMRQVDELELGGAQLAAADGASDDDEVLTGSLLPNKHPNKQPQLVDARVAAAGGPSGKQRMTAAAAPTQGGEPVDSSESERGDEEVVPYQLSDDDDSTGEDPDMFGDSVEEEEEECEEDEQQPPKKLHLSQPPQQQQRNGAHKGSRGMPQFSSHRQSRTGGVGNLSHTKNKGRSGRQGRGGRAGGRSRTFGGC